MRSKKITTTTIAATSVLLLLASGCSSDSTDGGGYPSKPVNLTAPAEPGSGWDTTARALAETIESESLVDVPVPVQNKPGGTGCNWLTETVNNDSGKDDSITITSLASQTMKARGLCDYDPSDVTMIATLYVENFIVVAPADGDIQNLDDLIGALENDPAKLPVAAAGDDNLPFALLADAAGVTATDVNFVSYDGGGEQTTALLNGDASVAIAGLSEFRSQLESGDLIPIVSFAEQKLEAPFADVPIAIEEGYDVSLGNWRGVYGPPEMPDEAVQYWEDTLMKATETQSWKDTVEKNQWSPEVLTGEEMTNYIDDTRQTVEEGVEKTGIGS